MCHSKGGSVHLYSHVIMQQQVDAISVTKIRPRWNNLGDIQIPTQCECLEENILFGFQTQGDIFTVLNFCILISKYHIYCQRTHKENGINFCYSLIELKNKNRIERYICTSTPTIEKFNKFQFLYEQL